MTVSDDITIAGSAPSEPGGEPLVTRVGGDVHFHFPVQVSVVGGLADADRELLGDEVFDRLHRALS